ncbi:MAG: S24/S26 family peptidase [Firmicutes bacterium]|nr:S24/S26 family peptidase [Clostridiales bacterium]MDD5883523.1 S24/S26 family peptidase [Bacillota bacterium]
MNEPIRLSEYNALIREVLESNGEFRLYPRGISMLPLLRQGRDSVALRRVDSPIRRNDILFYRRPDGSFVLHRVKAVTEAALSLWGDNQTVPEEGVSPDWVIGRVTRIFRDDKEVTCDGMGYRLYLLLWQFTITRGFLLKLCHLSERRNAL